MKLILDTHVLLLALSEPERLDRGRRQLIEDRSNAIYVSSVSAAEIAIKSSIGKLAFAGDLLALVEETGFEWIDLSAAEAARLQTLPFHHRDPFNRMLICQALERDLPIMTGDAMFERYGCGVV